MDKIKENKLKGALYGFCIGDSMGAATEFMSEEQIKAEYGQVKDLIGGGAFGWKPGECTDDTAMMLCVADALMKTNFEDDYANREFLGRCKDNFIEWFKTNPKDIGNQCRKAIKYLMQGQIQCCKDNNALGNGSLMRALPCSLMNEPFLNVLQGRMTHNNTICKEFILKYQENILDALNDKMYGEEIVNLVKPSGYIEDTYNNAVYWSKKENFEECIIGAVNHGGDSDTIAALTGGLAGARFGYNAIPKRWIEQLNNIVKDKTDKFLSFLIKNT